MSILNGIETVTASRFTLSLSQDVDDMANTFLSIPAESLPQFEELYVISDLHMGGESDHQMFNSGKELVRLIDYLGARLPAKHVALLINGDFVDFLAEKNAKHFDPEGAVSTLNRITEDDAFKDVFAALKKFANAKNRSLIINLGNHDLELALPWARARLLKILTGGNEAACARITFTFEGTGFPCRVGNATVLCVHGNEVDPWNVADYETIRRFGREVIHGRPIDSWIPNAGSQLVIDVMNSIKQEYPFVDLLKPETNAMVPTLLALAPDQHDKLRAIGSSVRRLALDTIKIATGFLGSKNEEVLQGRMAAAADILASGSGSFSPRGSTSFDRQEYVETLLDDAEDRYHRSVNPMTLVGEDALGGYLGLTSAFKKFVFGADKCEVLREALSDLGQDRSFDPTAEDSTFNKLDEQVGDGFDFVIAGHTHLARALKRKQKAGWYFNSGTWARLIRLEDRVIKDPEAFKRVFEVFGARSMEKLDALPNLVKRILTVVVIRADVNGTQGELRQVNLSPDADADVLPAETDYRFTKI